jgi:hypothetical protein
MMQVDTGVSKQVRSPMACLAFSTDLNQRPRTFNTRNISVRIRTGQALGRTLGQTCKIPILYPSPSFRIRHHLDSWEGWILKTSQPKGIGRHALLFGPISDSTTIRDSRVRLWRSADKSSPAEEVSAPAVSCLCYQALCAWHVGQIASSRNTMRRAITLARELNDTHALAVALFHAAFLVLPRRAYHGSRTAYGVIAPPVRCLTLRGP